MADSRPAAQGPDWERLAPVWEHLDGGGLNDALLATVAPDLRPPVLCVGGGIGTVPALLRDRIGPGGVVALDRSAAMCRRARRERNLPCVRADVTAIPLRAASCGSVLCATGVFEWLPGASRVAALREMVRVCGDAGSVVVVVADGDGDVAWGGDQHALVNAWATGRLPDESPAARAFGAVAAAVGGTEAARQLLVTALPRRGRSVTAGELLAAAQAAELPEPRRLATADGTAAWCFRS